MKNKYNMLLLPFLKCHPCTAFRYVLCYWLFECVHHTGLCSVRSLKTPNEGVIFRLGTHEIELWMLKNKHVWSNSIKHINFPIKCIFLSNFEDFYGPSHSKIDTEGEHIQACHTKKSLKCSKQCLSTNNQHICFLIRYISLNLDAFFTVCDTLLSPWIYPWRIKK